MNAHRLNRISNKPVIAPLAFAMLLPALAACQSPSSEPAADGVRPAAASEPPVKIDAAAEASSAGADCPSQDFNEFLKAYASDNSIRKRFTAPMVKVARVEESEDGSDQVVMTSVPAEQYDGFLFSYQNGKYGFSKGEAGKISGDPGLQLIVKAEPDGNYFVTIPDNVEAISYRFERHGNCWRLSEDPEAHV
jgi:hypothetical protein